MDFFYQGDVGVTGQDINQAGVPDVAFYKVSLFGIGIDSRREIIENGNDMAMTDKFLAKVGTYLAWPRPPVRRIREECITIEG